MRFASVTLNLGSLVTVPIGGVVLTVGGSTREFAGDDSVAPVYHGAPAAPRHGGTNSGSAARRPGSRSPDGVASQRTTDR
jgi:hypothetical protein